MATVLLKLLGIETDVRFVEEQGVMSASLKCVEYAYGKKLCMESCPELKNFRGNILIKDLW